MHTLTYTAFITFDGIVQDPHLWSMDFQSEDTGALVDEVMAAHDALLIGRGTYESFAGAWPSRSGDPFADKINAMPKYVVSTTLRDPAWHNTRVIDADVAARVRALKDETSVLVWGSPGLAQTLLGEDLVDELVLLYSPVVRSEGARLFGSAVGSSLRFGEPTLLSGGMLAVRATRSDA